MNSCWVRGWSPDKGEPRPPLFVTSFQGILFPSFSSSLHGSIDSYATHTLHQPCLIAVNPDRMAEREKWKTAFYYQYGLFEFRVITIGLINTPIIFQVIINHIFYDLLDNGILVYINDVLIYSKIIKEYNQLILDILKYLWGNNLIITL